MHHRHKDLKEKKEKEKEKEKESKVVRSFLEKFLSTQTGKQAHRAIGDMERIDMRIVYWWVCSVVAKSEVSRRWVA